MRSISLHVLVVALLGALPLSCSSKPPECVPHPTFLLTVNAMDGPLPDDVQLTFKYGSGTEIYRPGHPAPLQAAFCTPSNADAGVNDAGHPTAPLTSIVCELWTDGGATVTVQGTGYPKLERDLAAVTDDCGPVRTEVTVTLERGD